MLYLSTLTMNASGPLIKELWKRKYKVFDGILVCDGAITDKAKDYYKELGIKYFNIPWDDDYEARYRKAVWYVKDGDWILQLDDDEVPSDDLINCLADGIHLDSKHSHFKIPNILHLTEDGERYYPCEEEPPEEYPGGLFLWTKNILYQKTQFLDFHSFGSHVVPYDRRDKYEYFPAPYYHLKSLVDFIRNDVSQGFLHPEGQGFPVLESRKFRILTKEYGSSAELVEAAFTFGWSKALQKFAWDLRWKVDNPISRLAWFYFLIARNEFLEDDPEFTWDNVKQYIQGKEKMKMFEENKQNGNYITVGREV